MTHSYEHVPKRAIELIRIANSPRPVDDRTAAERYELAKRIKELSARLVDTFTRLDILGRQRIIKRIEQIIAQYDALP